MAAVEGQWTPGWAMYFGVVLVTSILQALSLAAFVAALLPRCRRRAGSARRSTVGEADAAAQSPVSEPIAAVVPCFLPNESRIIERTVTHLLENLVGVHSLDVYVVYNTPVDMAIEEELRNLARGLQRPGRRLFVQRVDGSTSKAENLNYALAQLPPETKYVAIYDADHRPDPDSLAMAIRHLDSSGVDCVQGSTYIRDGCFMARALVHAEFFVTYFVMQPVMRSISGTGFFGGANGVWARTAFRELRFDSQALTEDIDCFLQGILRHGLRFDFLPESCSGELLPAGPIAFWRQRLRWAMGWDQVTLRHAPAFWTAKLPLRQRLGLYYIFVCRWFSAFCAFVIIWFNTEYFLHRLIALRSLGGGVEGLQEAAPQAVQLVQAASFWLYAAFVALTFLRAWMHKQGKPGLCLAGGVLLYFSMLPLYGVFNVVLSSVSLLRVATGHAGKWVVTARCTAAGEAAEDGVQSPGPATAKAPLLGERPRKQQALNWWLGLVGFLGQGAAVGAIVGYVRAQRRVVHYFWGLHLPFHIGETTTVVIDYKIVVIGSLVGVSISFLVWFLILCLHRWYSR